MTGDINWLYDWDEALRLAAAERLHVFVDFFSNGCGGCRQQNEVTYASREVVEFLNSGRCLPLMASVADEEHSDRYLMRWTPFHMIMDSDGLCHQKSYGFQPPSEFIPWVLLGLAQAEIWRKNWPDALNLLEEVISGWPKSAAAPEAVFMRGVAGKRLTQDVNYLKAAYHKLVEEYPESPWAFRARPYRLF